MYEKGQGVAKDDAEAVKWLRKAADQGHAAAQTSLGNAYAGGRGVAKDETEALNWYRKAADQGNADARIRLTALQKKVDAAKRDRPATATPSPLQADPALRVYNNAVHRWSVSVPAGWKLDATNPADVRIHSPAGDGLCGMHSRGVTRFTTVDEYSDFMTAFNEQYFKDRGVQVRSSPKQRISLPNEVSGVDVLTEILSGGRSRRIYVLADGVGYGIDCETHATNWEKLEHFFARIIGSFTLERKP